MPQPTSTMYRQHQPSVVPKTTQKKLTRDKFSSRAMRCRHPLPSRQVYEVCRETNIFAITIEVWFIYVHFGEIIRCQRCRGSFFFLFLRMKNLIFHSTRRRESEMSDWRMLVTAHEIRDDGGNGDGSHARDFNPT